MSKKTLCGPVELVPLLTQMGFLDEKNYIVSNGDQQYYSKYLLKYFIKCSCSTSDLNIPFVNEPDVNPEKIWLHLKQSSIQAFFVFRESP